MVQAMTSPPPLSRRLTVEQYLEYEEAALGKQEYVAGELYAICGVSARHNRIAINILRRLSAASEGGPCLVFISDVKLRAAEDVVYYPDILVVCGPVDPGAVVLSDACLVVEVTSPSTARFDRSEKLDVYRRSRTLMTYLIVEQAWRRVTRHWRDSQGEWQRDEFTGGEGAIPIPCPETTLTLAEIYEGLAPLSVKEMEAIGYGVYARA